MKTFFKWFVLAILIAAIVGVFTTRPFSGVRMHPLTESDISQLADLKLSLVDDNGIAIYWFNKDGSVVGEFGQKGGPVTGPAFSWTLSKDGVLSFHPGDVKSHEWKAIRFMGDTVYVRTDEGVQVYRAEKRPPDPKLPL